MCRVGEVGLTPMSCEVRVRHELLRRPTADGVTTRGLERANDCGPERRPRRWRSSGRCTAMRSRSAPTDPPATTSAPIARPQVRPVIETVWRWCRSQLYPTDLLPKSPPAKALNYALQRRSILEVFLADPEVAIDTNHSERELRKLRLGKRNWLFNLTEIGAQLEASAASLPPRPFQLPPVGTTVARRKFYPLKERASYGALRMPANRLYFGNFSKKKPRGAISGSGQWAPARCTSNKTVKCQNPGQTIGSRHRRRADLDWRGEMHQSEHSLRARAE